MDITVLPAVRQLELLRSGTISALELAEEHIREIERLNPVLNALVDFDAERVRAQARAVRSGPLAGLPLTVKSSIEVAGHRCEIGSTLRRGVMATHDADAVAALRSAGAIILGTTNCPEFLMAYETDNLLHGRTRNPWDLDRSPGGSSGGESAAIAAGLSAVGLGSDSGGSVREPAHFTGICALKPTPGRISAQGHMPPCVGPFSSLGAVGPMARTIADVDLLFRVLCQSPQPGSAPVPYRPVPLEEAKGVTIGWFEDDGVVPVTPETRAAIQAAVQMLTSEGFCLKHHVPKGLEEALQLWRTFFITCGEMFYAPTIAGRREDLSPVFREFLHEASTMPALSAQTLLQAWADTDLLRARFLADMQDISILLLPVCSVPAFKHDERAWIIDGQHVGYWQSMRYTQWFNLLAMPAAVVPVGSSPEGLPIGVQIVGHPYRDELVLTVAGALDRAFGYRSPPLARS